jgi:hypothetical protein
MQRIPLTIILALSTFSMPGADDTQVFQPVAPRQLKRFAVNDLFTKNPEIEISSEHGPKAYFVRFQKVQDDIAKTIPAQNLGNAAKAYLEKFEGHTEVATDALSDLPEGQDLYEAWQAAMVIEKDNGAFEAYDVGKTSVQIARGTYAVQSGRHMVEIKSEDIMSALTSGMAKLEQVIKDGYELEEGSYYLVRAPISGTKNVTFALVNAQKAQMWLYTADYQLVDIQDMKASGQIETVLPALATAGGRDFGKVTTSRGEKETWKNEIGIPAAELGAGDFAEAYSG